MNNADKSYDSTKYNKRLMNNVVRMPVVIGGAQGSTIIDLENQRAMLDYWGDEGVSSLGMNTPEFLQSIMAFLASGAPHRLPDVYPHKVRWDAAEIICARAGMDRIFFACTGTEANEAAIKIARKYWWDREGEGRDQFIPKRHVVLTIAGNFHGRTGLSMAAGDFRVSPYHRHGFGPGCKGFGVLTEDTFQQVVTDAVEHEAHKPEWDKVAAVILAPVLGNNCVKTYPPKFWAELERLRKQHGFLLIYDDVQAGNGRSGNFATWQDPSIGVKPDIMTLAKGIAMGLPMSCMLASEDVAASFTPGVHFNTFGGTLITCFMAIRMYTWLDNNIEQVRKKGEYVRAQFAASEWIKSYDGMGMLNAFTLDFERYGYDAYEFSAQARELGLSLVTHRQYGPIRFTPPLNTTLEELDRALHLLRISHETLASKKSKILALR